MPTPAMLFLLILLCTVSPRAYSQVDSADIDDDTDTTTQIVQINKITPHKRGVYKTHEEYLSNSPSIDVEFTLQPAQISRNNPLVAEAFVKYIGKKPKNIWGISDGEHVYLRVILGDFFKNHFFRLQCDGPKPYIYYVEKPMFITSAAGLLVKATVAASSAALPPFVSLMIVRDNTNYMKPALLATNARIKRYLEAYPDLLEAYNEEPKHNKATKAKYITQYNLLELKNPSKTL